MRAAGALRGRTAGLLAVALLGALVLTSVGTWSAASRPQGHLPAASAEHGARLLAGRRGVDTRSRGPALSGGPANPPNLSDSTAHLAARQAVLESHLPDIKAALGDIQRQLSAARAAQLQEVQAALGELREQVAGAAAPAGPGAGAGAAPRAGDGSGRDAAFVAVFSFGTDPQRARTYEKDNAAQLGCYGLEYCQRLRARPLPPPSTVPKQRRVPGWYASCMRLNMTCLVLHDEAFTNAFVEALGTPLPFLHSDLPTPPADGGRGGVGFVRVDAGAMLEAAPETRGLTTPDARFILLEKFLAEHDGTFDYVLLTDSQDVSFRRNPFHFMKDTDASSGHMHIYTQDEWRANEHMHNTFDKHNNTVSPFGRLEHGWQNCFGSAMPQTYNDGFMPNCGILGGHVDVVRPFLARMAYWYSQVRRSARFLDCSMQVHWRTIMEDYNDRVIHGMPFHARFKYRHNDHAFIYHKSQFPP